MSAIVRYFIQMLPYMIVTAPVYIIVRVIFAKVKMIKVNWYRETLLFAFVIFTIALASQTVLPEFEFGANGLYIIQNGVHKTNLIPLKVLWETYTEVFVNENLNYFLINFLGNVILFVPFGLFIPLLWNVSAKKTVLIGFLSSLLIETCQLFLIRATDVDDLLLNTSGVLLGVAVFQFLKKNCKSFVEKFDLPPIVSAKKN